MTELSVIVVTFNTGHVVLNCLKSIPATIRGRPVEIIVVDNNSSDATATLVRTYFPDARLIIGDDNRGFGAGNNVGVQHATGKYVALVNPDLILHENTLEKLIDVLTAEDNVGVVGPRTFLPDGTINMTARSRYTVAHIAITYLMIGHLFPRLRYREAYTINQYATEPREVAWLQGSCLLLRRATFESIGGFDENFFLYSEDADLCERLRQAGQRVVYVPQATATHIGRLSTASFPLVRVRSYHLSPLHYFRKRQQLTAVRMLKLVFALELSLKIFLRALRNLIQPDLQQRAQVKAECTVLVEMWRY